MAEGKKTFIFYSDWINMVREMPNEDAGALLKHVLSYVNDESPETDNVLVKMAFGHMKPLIKGDLKKWETIREKRKKAGAKGGKTTQANAKQNQANAKQVQAVNDNVNVSTYVDYSESNFLENWNEARTYKTGEQSNFNRLKQDEADLFWQCSQEYKKDDFHKAIKGLFGQESIPKEIMWFRPRHFLGNIETYIDAYENKKYNLYV
jgi:hypothetical protein